MACKAKLLYTLAIEPEKPKLLTLFESGMGQKNERKKKQWMLLFPTFPGPKSQSVCLNINIDTITKPEVV